MPSHTLTERVVEMFRAARNCRIEHIVDAGVHVGHSSVHPRALFDVLGKRNNIHLYDPYECLARLRRAANFVRLVSAQDGNVAFVATRNEFIPLVTAAALHSHSFYIPRWIFGTLVNRENVVGHSNKIEPSQTPIPDVLVLTDLKSRAALTAVNEARIAKIPVVAIADTDTDLSQVSYSVPGNDDSLASVTLIINALAQAVLDGNLLNRSNDTSPLAHSSFRKAAIRSISCFTE